jgi:hypothetical protein
MTCSGRCSCVQRTEATIKAPDGSSFKVTKGAAHAVLGLVQVNAEVAHAVVNRKVRAPLHLSLHWSHLLCTLPSLCPMACIAASKGLVACSFVLRMLIWEGCGGAAESVSAGGQSYNVQRSACMAWQQHGPAAAWPGSRNAETQDDAAVLPAEMCFVPCLIRLRSMGSAASVPWRSRAQMRRGSGPCWAC